MMWDFPLTLLIEDCKGLIGLIENRAYLLVSKNKLTDNETLALHLLAAYLGYRLGMLETDALSKEELQYRLGKSAEITSTRLSELVKAGMVERNPNGSYRITGFGVALMQREWLPRIKAKIESRP